MKNEYQTIAVVGIASGNLIYVGKSTTLAATTLIPGTCFGKGEDEDTAIRMARRWAERFMGMR